MIEQVNFTYIPFGKAFEKQTKTIKDQGEKQVKSIQNQGQVKASKKNTSNDKDERLEEITALDKNINLDHLI